MSDKRLTVTIEKKSKTNEKSEISLWCDGRAYDPVAESYRPIYSYVIRANGWEYVGNDLRGDKNKKPNIASGMKSLLAFLNECAESRDVESHAFNLFPEHVRDWAVQKEAQIAEKYAELLVQDGK